MKFIPHSVTRLASRSLLKVNANSPTILVVGGVVGLGVSAVLAAKATRKIDPVLDEHKQARAEIGYVSKAIGSSSNQAHGRELAGLYTKTGFELAKIYAPAIALGTISATSILYGHKILRGRHVATMLAYSGLQEQFLAYRGRVAQTLGEQAERDIFQGAHGEWHEVVTEKGEVSKELSPVWDQNSATSYLRPWFDETNVHWSKDPIANWLFLRGTQQHFNNVLQIRGYVFLNDIFDALNIPRTQEGQAVGWVWHRDGGGEGDNYIDFGFMTGNDPHTRAFRDAGQGLVDILNGGENTVQLNFNVDGLILDKNIWAQAF